MAVPSAKPLARLELQGELIPRLCSIDTPALVLTPMRVRSLLVRERRAMPTTSTPAPAGVAPTISVDHAAAPEVVAAVADRFAASDLATMLQEVAAELEPDVEATRQPAAEDAPLAAEAATAATTSTASESDPITAASPSVSDASAERFDAPPAAAEIATESSAVVADHAVPPILPDAPLVSPASPAPPDVAGPHDHDEVAARLEATAAALTRTGASLQRVERFLGELEQALAELARRPKPAHSPIDVAPLVEAVQTGFQRATAQSSATTVALTGLTDRIRGLGRQVDAGVQQAMAAWSTRAVPTHAAAIPVATQPVTAPAERTPIAMAALAALVSGWSLLFWFKTGSPRLALGTLIAGNLVGCCLLLSRRPR